MNKKHENEEFLTVDCHRHHYLASRRNATSHLLELAKKCCNFKLCVTRKEVRYPGRLQNLFEFSRYVLLHFYANRCDLHWRLDDVLLAITQYHIDVSSHCSSAERIEIKIKCTYRDCRLRLSQLLWRDLEQKKIIVGLLKLYRKSWY